GTASARTSPSRKRPQFRRGFGWLAALVNNPLDPKKKVYLANDGDVICVSNFETALLDLPIKSPKDNADLVYVAHTSRIPPPETKVVVVLEPLPAAMK